MRSNRNRNDVPKGKVRSFQENSVKMVKQVVSQSNRRSRQAARMIQRVFKTEGGSGGRQKGMGTSHVVRRSKLARCKT